MQSLREKILVLIESEFMCESEIIIMFQENNPFAWSHLYDKYASAMLGSIYKLTNDKILSEEILLKVFLELKQTQILSKIQLALLPVILRFTHLYTLKHLKVIGVSPKHLKQTKESKLVDLLTTQCSSLKEAAVILNITATEGKQKLHLEFLKLRMQNNLNKLAHSYDGISLGNTPQSI